MADELLTPRLLLRRWRADDEAAMAAINRDPEVARHLNRPVDDAAVEGFLAAMLDHWERHGFGPYAVESREPELAGRFVGFAGLAHLPPFLAAAGPEPELSWRLARSAWGRGLATEAAATVRDDVLARRAGGRLISVIHPENVRSQRVASKLGMTRGDEVHNPLLGRDVDVWQLPVPGA